jgi:hypothetical protein
MAEDFDEWVLEIRAERERKHNTSKLLKYCKKAGITRLALCIAHKSVPHSMQYGSFMRSSAIQYPTEARYDEWRGMTDAVWPAIWWAARQAGVHGGCGGYAQAQVNAEKVAAGVYHLNPDTGRWKKVV